MTIALLPLLVCALGLVVYALSSNPKVAEAGRIAYFVGLFWIVELFANHIVRL